MLRLVLGQKPSPWVIVLVDQTSLASGEVVSAAIPLAGRALPVAWVDCGSPLGLYPPYVAISRFWPASPAAAVSQA